MTPISKNIFSVTVYIFPSTNKKYDPSESPTSLVQPPPHGPVPRSSSSWRIRSWHWSTVSHSLKWTLHPFCDSLPQVHHRQRLLDGCSCQDEQRRTPKWVLWLLLFCCFLFEQNKSEHIQSTPLIILKIGVQSISLYLFHIFIFWMEKEAGRSIQCNVKGLIQHFTVFIVHLIQCLHLMLFILITIQKGYLNIRQLLMNKIQFCKVCI